jgi:DsbC/DsbD-like thiol-disulfide interchange protein
MEALAQFAQEHGIEYPLLSDDGSKVIREFGILNTLIRPDEAIYGIPYPGSYLVDENGLVVEKFFHREYQMRETPLTILRSGFSVPVDLSRLTHAETEASGVHISAALTTSQLKFMQRSDLYVHLRLPDGLHVYGQPVPEGYFATEVSVSGPEGLRIGTPRYPQARPLRIEALNEEFRVFEGDVEIVVPLVCGSRAGEGVPIDVEVRYQACSDETCFLPASERVHLDVPLGRLVAGQRRE